MSLDLETLAEQPLESLGDAAAGAAWRQGQADGGAPRFTARARARSGPDAETGARRGGKRGEGREDARDSGDEDSDYAGLHEVSGDDVRDSRRGKFYDSKDGGEHGSDEESSGDDAVGGRARRRRRRGRSHRRQQQFSDDGDFSGSEGLNAQDDAYDSDSISPSQSASEMYKVRYRVLREAYESRLKNLVTQMHSTYADTVRDEAVRALGERPETAPFIPLRRQEVVREALESETEESFQRATHDLAKQASELHRAKKRIHDLKKQVRKMSRAQHDLRSARNELGSTQTELSRSGTPRNREPGAARDNAGAA